MTPLDLGIIFGLLVVGFCNVKLFRYLQNKRVYYNTYGHEYWEKNGRTLDYNYMSIGAEVEPLPTAVIFVFPPVLVILLLLCFLLFLRINFGLFAVTEYSKLSTEDKAKIDMINKRKKEFPEEFIALLAFINIILLANGVPIII